MFPKNFTQAYPEALQPGDNPNTGELPIRIARDPVTDSMVLPGQPRPVFIVSCWQLSEDELKQIKKTGCIYVAVMADEKARTQPPICAMGFNPFTHQTPTERNWKPVARTLSEELVDELIEKAQSGAELTDEERKQYELDQWLKTKTQDELAAIASCIREQYEAGVDPLVLPDFVPADFIVYIREQWEASKAKPSAGDAGLHVNKD